MSAQKAKFMAEAKPFIVTITDGDGKVVKTETLDPKEFSTGSVGYHANCKVDCDGRRHQLNVLMTVVGSKEWQ